MLKPSLQLKLGQQLTMTPQLQQAIRLLQLPALELQAHIRELLETQRDARADGRGRGHRDLRGRRDRRRAAQGAERTAESTVEVLDDGWGERASGPAETPLECATTTSGSRTTPTPAGQSLQEHLLWQLELATLAPRELAIARAIVDAISDDGYLTESLEEIAQHPAPGAGVHGRGSRSRARRRAGARSARGRRALGGRVHRAAAAAAGSGDPRL